MNFDLSADQVALRDAARDLLDGRCAMTVVRAAMERRGTHDPELWQAMVDQGWCGIAVPESAGGVGLGWVEAVLLVEEVGAHVAPAPIVSQLVAIGFLIDGPWGPGMLEGRSIAAVSADLDAPVPDAPEADVVVAAHGDELVMIELEDRPEVVDAMDLTRPLGWVVTDRSPLVTIGDARDKERFVDLGAVAYSAELLGIAQRVLDLSVDYAKERVQFGRPIGSFQAVKHRCADMLVDVEGMRSAVWWAAWCVSAGHPDASVAASTAKTWCSEAAMRVCSSALQVHGGVGFTWEHDLHLYLKRAHVDSLAFGTASWHRDRLARLLRGRVEAGHSVI